MFFFLFETLNRKKNLSNRMGILFWILNGTSAVILCTFIPITWFKKLWVVLRRPTEDDITMVHPPKNRFLLYFFDLSRDIMKNAISRIAMYITMVTLLTTCSLIHLVNRKCTMQNCIIFEIFIFVALQVECYETGEAKPNPTEYDINYTPCLNPWVIFFFSKIHFVKLYKEKWRQDFQQKYLFWLQIDSLERSL